MFCGANGQEFENRFLTRFIDSLQHFFYFIGQRQGTFRPALFLFNDVAGIFIKLGLAETKEMDLKGSKIKARDIATAIVLALPVLAENFTLALVDDTLQKYGDFGIEGVVLRVDVRGKKAGKAFQYSYGAGSNADLLTALPSVLAALMYCRGEIKGAGVFAPEGIVNSPGELTDPHGAD